MQYYRLTALVALALGPTLAMAGTAHRARLKAKVRSARDSTIPIDGTNDTVVPLGTAITWQADVENPTGSPLWYRYRVTGPDGVQRLLRDFGPDSELAWTTIDAEGAYRMELTVRKLDSNEVDVDSVVFQFEALATTHPVVWPTTHPQVLIYSAPRCAFGSTMKVLYVGPSGKTAETPEKACGGPTMNFYVGGLLKQSEYQLHHEVTNFRGQRFEGPVVTGQSGTPIYQFAEPTVVKAAAAGAVNPVMLFAPLFEPIHATDLDGNVIWYYLSRLQTVARPEGSGRFWGFGENGNLGPDSQIIRQFDLVGSTLLETNAARVNEQLAAMGKDPITGFHHEIRPLENGNILVLAAVERILTNVQGDGDVDVLGDMILVLNPDLEVVWTWNSFDHLDPARAAVLGEQCGPNGAGCAPFYKAGASNDWTHGNSLQLTADGNILYSARHQDWVVKIDYQNGGGSGQILWKLGKDGDFTVISDDPWPWFSHQHDANFDTADPTLLQVFDNGNTRQSANPAAHSRGQVYKIDEQRRTASLLWNADLGDFSLALGSAAKLPNGNYHFDLGWIQGESGPASRVLEVDPSGKIVYEIDTQTAFYRAFRLASLYAGESR